MFGIPFIDSGGIGVAGKPLFGFPQHIEQFCVFGCTFEFGLCLSFAQPCQSGSAVGIQYPRQVMLFEIRQAQDDGEELTDVVGPL